MFKKSCILRRIFRWKYLLITTFAFVAIGALAYVTVNLSFLNPIAQTLENFSMSDVYYQISSHTGKKEKSMGVTLVDMTLLYDRADIAKAIKDVEHCKPKVLGVDIVFEGLMDGTDGNDSLRVVAERYDNIVWSYRVMNYADENVGYADAMHSFFTDSVKTTEGCTNMERSLYGNMKRQFPMYITVQGENDASFIAKIVEKYSDGSVKQNLDDEMLDINFTPTDFTVLPADSVLLHPELIQNRIVLFGAMYEETDMHYTPIGKMAGMELLAYSVQTLIDNKAMKSVPQGWFWMITVLLVYITIMLQDAFIALARRIRNEYIRDIISSSYVVSIVTFVWMTLLLGISFVIFNRYHVSFNLGWAFAAMACLEISKDLWEAGSEKVRNSSMLTKFGNRVE